MRELELAVPPSNVPTRPPAGARGVFSLSRATFFASIAAHVAAGYALSLHKWGAPPPAPPTADFFLFERPTPRPAEPAPEAAPAPAAEERPRESEQPPPEQPEPPAPPRAADVVPESNVVVETPPSPPASEPVPVEEVAPTPSIDFDEERRRAVREVLTERAAESEYLTFSMDDVAPPRPEQESEPKRSIFDGGRGSDFGGRSVGTVGSQRTKFGRKVAELCNALTGGFGVSFLGFGLFSACATPDGGPTGLFPEVRPAYLDLMPVCVDTRDTAPALALEAPFSTIKCRLVNRAELQEQP